MSDDKDSNVSLNGGTLVTGGPDPQFSPAKQYGAFRWIRVVLTAVTIVLLGSLAVGTAWYMANIEPSLYPVKGFVFLDGQPMAGGAIVSDHVGGWEGSLGAIGDDGSFEFTTNGARGAYAGKHRLSFSLMDKGFPPRSLLPAKYIDPNNPAFTIEVSATTQGEDIRFDLIGSPPPPSLGDPDSAKQSAISADDVENPVKSIPDPDVSNADQ